ncbi:MAG TPA: ABC transporter permease [Candidatus Angelobacter sp.]
MKIKGKNGSEFRQSLTAAGYTICSFVRLEHLLRDLRHALRMLRRNPGFTAVVILTLALGIGMTSAMFSVVNAVLLTPLPYPDADRLIWIAPADPDYPPEDSVSRADYLLWKAQAHSFEAFTAYGNTERALVYGGQSSTVQIASTSDNFWSICGAKPMLGRLFGEHERDALVLSWELFQDRFGGDPQVVGKTTTLDAHPFTVVGVLPKSFRFVLPPEMYAGDPIPEIVAYIPLPEGHEAPGDPIRENAQTGPTPTWVGVVGRLKPGVSFTQARAEMQVIYDRVRQIPSAYSRWPNDKLRFIPLSERVAGEARLALILLFSAVGFVLLIAGANFANLLMARASTLERELAVRTALGASRMHLLRQFLVESILLATLGGAAGLLIARSALSLAVRIGSHAVPRLADVKIGSPVLLFTLAVSLATGILFGLAPALGLRRNTVAETLKREGGTASAGAGQLRFRRWLVTTEFALAILLLTGAGLMLRSFWRMHDFPPGFEPGKLLVANISHSSPRYFRNGPKQRAYLQELFTRVEGLHGVESFGVHCGTLYQSLEMVGSIPHSGGKDAIAVRYVSPGFFRAVRAPLIRGRWPSDAEWREFKDVVMVNQNFAYRFANGDIVGKHLRAGVVDATVIGVVSDFKDFQLDAPPEPQVYMPYPLAPGIINVRLFLRVAADPKLVEASLGPLVSGLDPDVPIRIETLEQTLSQSITPRRFNMYLFEAFAGAAVGLALIGIYGVLAYLIKQRTREIGIRMALGAHRRQIVNLVVWEGMRIALLGIAVGTVAAVALTRLIASLLYQTQATDPFTFVSVVLLMALISLLACLHPARKAARTDPVISLRHE